MKQTLTFFVFFIFCANLTAQYNIQFIVEDLSIQNDNKIYIAGTFNSWAAINENYLLKTSSKRKKTITLSLPAGKHE
ncbi:MAG: hypothetical protein ACXWCG_06535 [Flavitalea sp.]